MNSSNRDHVAARSIVELSELRSAAARGQGTSNNDIDVLVIRPDAIGQEHSVWTEQVMGLTEAVWRRSGNACQTLEYTADEFARLVRSRDTLVDNLRTDAVGLVGKAPRELTRAER